MLSTLVSPHLDTTATHRRAAREFERLRSRSVVRTGLLDSGADERFDRITRTAAQRFDMPFSTLTLIVDDRQYIKSMVGPFERNGSRSAAFCNVTIQSEDGFIIQDTLQHPLFSTSSFVVGAPHLRFYAGIPLRGPGGWFVGSLCVMDTRPRTFTEADHTALRRIADRSELELNSAA